MNKQNIKNFLVSLTLASAIASAGIFGVSNSVLAQTGSGCPSLTTVTGTTVTFVGELADNGGDTSAVVWFEYKPSSGSTQKTAERTLFSPGIYCITVFGLQPGVTYSYQAAARNSVGTSFGEVKTFTTSGGFVTVDIKANGSDGPIFINSGNSVVLSWNSNNADFCTASNNWFGNKSTSGSESMGALSSSRTFTLTCSGPGGSASDSVFVNVAAAPFPVVTNLIVDKLVRNLSDNTVFSNSINADPGEILTYSIRLTAGSGVVENAVLFDTLPNRIIFQGNLKVDGVSSGGSLTSGLNLGSFAPNQTKTVTFEAAVAAASQFGSGQTNLINAASVQASNASGSDTATVVVVRGIVAGATDVPTGVNDKIIDYVLLPALLAIALILIFRRKIFGEFEGQLKPAGVKNEDGKLDDLLRIKTK